MTFDIKQCQSESLLNFRTFLPPNLSTMTKITVTPTGVVAVVATSYILYDTWKNTPEWLSFRKKRKARHLKDANDDLADPQVILAKLQQLRQLVQEKTGNVVVDLPWYKLHACFLSLFHLSAEIRLKHPEHRDNLYQSCGPALDKKQAIYLRQMLDYAHWAYLSSYTELSESLSSRGYQVLRHDVATEPGRVGHYIALNYTERTCLIGLKGTSTFSDVLTDVVGACLPHTLPDKQDIICHEGIFTAATMVADDLELFLKELIIPQQFKILITGHSLGAGTACLLGIILKSRIQPIDLVVVAFATPAVLSYKACLDCLEFCTSVVNNSDMVPRLSISNLLTMNHGLVEVNRRLDEKGLSPDSLRNAYRYAADLLKLDEDTLMTVEELDALFLEIHSKDSLEDDHDLYVPGKVVALYECGVEQKNQEEESIVGTSVEPTKVRGVVADGAMKMLRQIELTTSMVTDHFCDYYEKNLDCLIEAMS